MANLTMNKLVAIQDEVKEFHPILEALLPKLPAIQNVEYTHGNREMGADFVASKLDETLGDLSYVGVIAKVGKIVQDFSDIERQIDECQMPRLFNAGTKKIRIDEIWVIATQNISNNAQGKIYEKYKNRKLNFIQGSKLAKLIDQHLPTFSTDLPVKLTEQLSGLHEKILEADRRLSLIPAQQADIYIEADIREKIEGEYDQEKGKRLQHRKVDFKEILRKKKFVFFEGSLGSGKSKLLRHIAMEYAFPESFVKNRIYPIYESYKELKDSFEGNIDRLIKANIPLAVKQILPPDVRYIVMIDGLDEVDQGIEEQIRALNSLADQAFHMENTVVVVSSRFIEGFTGREELHKEVTRVELSPLSFNKTIEFLRQLCTKINLTKHIIEDLKRSQLFRELPHSPIAAILLARLLTENSEDIPANMTELYSKYTELTLGRWDIEKGLQSQKEYQALDSIMTEMATFMMQNELIRLPLGDARQIFTKYLEARNLEIKPLFLLERIKKRCDLVFTSDDNNFISFRHRTFAEFLHAKSLRRTNSFSINEKAFHPYWQNTFFFAIGLQKDCPEELNQLVTLDPKSDPARWTKLINMSNYLLAAYTTPYDVIINGITETMRDAAKFYKRVVSGNCDEPFSGFSPMALLFIMQFIIRNSYAFQFFQKALDTAALSIDEGNDPDDEKAYALFFLNVISLELGNGNPFDFLLDRYAQKLPLDLTMGIYCESKLLTDRSKLVRKQTRKVRHLLTGNKSLQNQVDALFDNPIRKDQKGKKITMRHP